jgi:hypothetical protein
MASSTTLSVWMSKRRPFSVSPTRERLPSRGSGRLRTAHVVQSRCGIHDCRASLLLLSRLAVVNCEREDLVFDLHALEGREALREHREPRSHLLDETLGAVPRLEAVVSDDFLQPYSSEQPQRIVLRSPLSCGRGRGRRSKGLNANRGASGTQAGPSRSWLLRPCRHLGSRPHAEHQARAPQAFWTAPEPTRNRACTRRRA